MRFTFTAASAAVVAIAIFEHLHARLREPRMYLEIKWKKCSVQDIQCRGWRMATLIVFHCYRTSLTFQK